MTKSLYVLVLTAFMSFTVNAQNNILDISIQGNAFEFRCNKHLNIIPKSQDITCVVTLQQGSKTPSKTVFNNRIGLANFSFTGTEKGFYTVQFKSGKCKATYNFDYKGTVPPIKSSKDNVKCQ